MDNGNPHRVLTREQKTGFVLLLIFGLLAVGLGILQMRNTIFGPFTVRISKTADVEQDLFADENARLQSIDTDHDGLNDYEEINFYETSAYLPDTDSDGLVDKIEIENGTDPLCPKGDVCEKGEGLPAPAGNSFLVPELPASEFNPLDALDEAVGGGSVKETAQIDELQKLLADPAQIRSALLAGGGMTKEKLDKIDDATLMELMEEILQEQAVAPTTTKK